MFESILYIHGFFASLFVLYIIVDRLYVRHFIDEEKRVIFYKKVKWPMLVICLVLIISGGYILLEVFSIYYLIKAVLGLFLIFSFFYCPVFMKKELSKFKRFMYRYFVVLLMVFVVLWGLYI